MADNRKIRKRMSVIAADGRRIGFVRAVVGPDKIRLTCLGSSHGFDHLIPIAWVSEVEKYVFLSKTSRYVGDHWQNISPGPARATPAIAEPSAVEPRSREASRAA